MSFLDTLCTFRAMGQSHRDHYDSLSTSARGENFQSLEESQQKGVERNTDRDIETDSETNSTTESNGSNSSGNTPKQSLLAGGIVDASTQIRQNLCIKHRMERGTDNMAAIASLPHFSREELTALLKEDDIGDFDD